MLTKAKFVLLFVIALFIFVGTAYTQPTTATLSTPELIEEDVANGNISTETGYLYLSYALFDYQNLPTEYESNVPWSGTLYLLQLQEEVAQMPSTAGTASINTALAGSCNDSAGTLANEINSATNFYVQYGTIGGGLSINDYTQSLETSWITEVDTFGWAAPPVGSNPAPEGRYHVRIDNLGGGLYGYVSPSGTHAGFVGNNPNTPWNDEDAFASCMVLNEDYTGFSGSSQQALDATTAHEFNHSIQFGIGALAGAGSAETVFIEGGATWMEDEVFDAANDNYNYLWPQFDVSMGNYTSFPYPYWITFRGMTERYGIGVAGGGEQVMQDFWEETSKGSSQNLDAMNVALQNKGTNLADAYHAYAIAVKFNKNCGGGYVYPYCFAEASNYVGAAGNTAVTGNINSVEGTFTGSVQDNYALNWVSLPISAGLYNVYLLNTGGGQLRGSVVCDDGASLSVTPLSMVAAAADTAVLNNYNSTGCSSVILVITNQNQTAANPSSSTPRSYRVGAITGKTPTLDQKVYLPMNIK